MKGTRVIKFVSLLLIAMLVFVGCYQVEAVRGGGWIPSATDSDEKANFGFTVRFTGEVDERGDYEAKGQFQYNDKAAGEKIHGAITSVTGLIEEKVSWFGTYTGYTFYGVDSDGEDFWVFASGNDLNGKFALDSVIVGRGFEIINGGVIGGGNITFWELKEEKQKDED